ncbi:hypothetical protein CRG98_034092 [Punica granatum]|uniref:Uncharacterized protein n=1 Tax=Punica granatum TaxID=22663 RepID=A0A2I0INJ1_PUNGR|nr:hypothetical protein CRG98_034092 [Punica granatum]
MPTLLSVPAAAPVSSSNLKPPPASSDLTSTTLPQPHHGSCHQSFAHVPTSNYGSFELGGEVCNNWGFAFDFLEELIQVADCVDSGEQGSRKATTSFLAIWGSLTELGPAQPPREISVTVGTRKKMARLKHLTE